MGEDEARALATRVLRQPLPQRWAHVQAVAAEATRLCDRLRTDRGVVVSAAWLHDIGYAPTIADTGFHPLDGARYLRAHGWDDEVCRLVAHHTDAVHQVATANLGERLAREFEAMDGLASDVLWTADATTGPNGERFTLGERIAEIAERYGPDHPITHRMIRSRDVLEAAIDRVSAVSH